jgi:hypothetical protein
LVAVVADWTSIGLFHHQRRARVRSNDETKSWSVHGIVHTRKLASPCLDENGVFCLRGTEEGKKGGQGCSDEGMQV